MTNTTGIDWSDVAAAAKQMAGNWRKFASFSWRRSRDLDAPDAWMLCFTSYRNSGSLSKANERIINERLEPYSEGEDPDVVLERHDHFAVGYVDGFSLRVVRPDGTVTEAFQKFCRIFSHCGRC